MQVLVLYYSRGGNTKTLAQAITKGIESTGSTAVMKSTSEVTKDDFLNSAGIIAGSPVYFGVMAWELKKVFDEFVSIRKHMEEKGVCIATGTPVERIIGDSGGKVRAVAAGGGEHECGIVVLATGVRPNVRLAREARITIGPTGAIMTDRRMETSVRGIYAAGDCAETKHLVSGKPAWFPLGSTANKQGRVAGANIAGGNKSFPGVLGTSIVKVFDLSVGRTGLTEREAREAGINPLAVTVTTPVRPGYYPGGGKVTLKMTADRGSKRLLGVQAAGDSSVDKIVDTAAAALTGGLGIEALTNVDLAYSPPYAPALGAIIVAAGVLEEKL